MPGRPNLHRYIYRYYDNRWMGSNQVGNNIISKKLALQATAGKLVFISLLKGCHGQAPRNPRCERADGRATISGALTYANMS